MGRSIRSLLAATMVVGLLAGCGGDGGGEPASATPLASAAAPPSTERPTAEEIRDQIQVVDVGFTETPSDVAACEQDPASDVWFPEGCARSWISFGTIVENTGDQVAEVAIRWTPLDAAGQPIAKHESIVVDEDDDPAGTVLRIGLLAPGERMGIGDNHDLARPGVADIRVDVEEPRDWWPEVAHDSDVQPDLDGELTVSNVQLGEDEHGQPTLELDVTSSYDRTVHMRDVACVLYDDRGHIVGGGTSFAELAVDAGSTTHAEANLVGADVSELDPARVEVYVLDLRTVNR